MLYRVLGASFISFAVSLTALATQTKNFASCYGDHHGSNLNLFAVYGSEGLAQVNAVITTDADESEVTARVFTLEEVTKNGIPLELKAYSWAIRQAIKAEAKGEFYGYVKVKARGADGKLLYINLQKMGGLTNSLVVDGTAETLTCPLEGIED